MSTNVPIKIELESDELLEAVTNILDNEYLTKAEKEVVFKMANFYKVQRMFSPKYTTTAINDLKQKLITLYEAHEEVSESDGAELARIEQEIQQIELLIHEEYVELEKELNKQGKQVF